MSPMATPSTSGVVFQTTPRRRPELVVNRLPLSVVPGRGVAINFPPSEDSQQQGAPKDGPEFVTGSETPLFGRKRVGLRSCGIQSKENSGPSNAVPSVECEETDFQDEREIKEEEKDEGMEEKEEGTEEEEEMEDHSDAVHVDVMEEEEVEEGKKAEGCSEAVPVGGSHLGTAHSPPGVRSKVWVWVWVCAYMCTLARML